MACIDLDRDAPVNDNVTSTTENNATLYEIQIQKMHHDNRVAIRQFITTFRPFTCRAQRLYAPARIIYNISFGPRVYITCTVRRIQRAQHVYLYI